MSGRGGGGRGRGWYYKQKYGGGGSQRRQQEQDQAGDEAFGGASWAGGAAVDEQPRQAAPGRQPRGDAQALAALLGGLEGKGYKAYRDIEGAWACPQGFTLLVDHAQADPYATPSRLRAQVPPATAQLPPALLTSKLRRVALGDWLARKLAAEANRASAAAAGQASGWHGAKGGDVTVDMPGQHVLERTAVLVAGDGSIEARFTVGLPAQGRSIMGRWAAQILTQHLTRAVGAALLYPVLDGAAIWRHIQTVEDQQALRDALPGLGLIGFVADGAILPRASGVSDLPMAQARAVPFAAPPSLAVEVGGLPHRGSVRGLGIRRGITVIAGGGFHGKSTLLEALEVGVYNKVPGDGRELVVMVDGAVKVLAEDGRRVEAVDIRPFINGLPGGTSTAAFCSADASGSTSQAASIQEALELGARCLLLDEDTCATNLMMRDARMAQLVAPQNEPITPFSNRIRLLRDCGVSTVLVSGASGEYFAAADTVLVMTNWRPEDATARAHAIAAQHAGAEAQAAGSVFFTPRAPTSVYPAGAGDARGVKTHVRGKHHIQYGDQDVQLAALEQLVDRSQTAAIAGAMRWLHVRLLAQQQPGPGGGGGRTLLQWLQQLEAELDQQGLDVLAPHLGALGNLARPRRFEIGAALNRLRSLQAVSVGVQQQPGGG